MINLVHGRLEIRSWLFPESPASRKQDDVIIGCLTDTDIGSRLQEIACRMEGFYILVS